MMTNCRVFRYSDAWTFLCSSLLCVVLPLVGVQKISGIPNEGILPACSSGVEKPYKGISSAGILSHPAKYFLVEDCSKFVVTFKRTKLNRRHARPLPYSSLELNSGDRYPWILTQHFTSSTVIFIRNISFEGILRSYSLGQFLSNSLQTKIAW